MDQKTWNASITVFLSLVCILFLSLICAATESARMQGAKAQSAAITGMGTFSLLSEFEPKLLEKYEIFAFDGGRSGKFRIQEVDDKLEKYLSKNVNPKEGLLGSVNYDPWNLALSESGITSYTLLTDDGGEAFYQQAVSVMIHNFLPDVLDAVSKLDDSEEVSSRESEYEQAQEKKEQGVEDLEGQVQEYEAEQAQIAENGGTDIVIVTEEAPSNPELEREGQEAKGALEMIKQLRGDKGLILNLVTWGKQVSDKKVTTSGLPSVKISQKGTLPVEKEYSGIFYNVAFREYLLKYFSNFTDKKSGTALNYQIEYLITGKKSDVENIKHVVTLLLGIREAANWISCNMDSTKRNSTLKMTEALCSLIPSPGIAQAAGVILGEVILLAWAFAESLVDVRILLDDGKVPILKNEKTWKLDLDSLPHLQSILINGSTGEESGLSYKDYLRMILNIGTTKKQKMRALDLIQMEMQTQNGMENFKAENCIVAVEANAVYECSPVFFSVPRAFMGISGPGLKFTQTASLSY